MNSLILSIVGALLVAEAANCMPELLQKNLWTEFKQTHDKKYTSTEHESLKFSVFQKNLEMIEKHNAEFEQGNKTYTLGVNFYADWTFDEFKHTYLGTKLSLAMKKNMSTSTFLKMVSPAVKIADEIDWRELGAVTEVKNQGQCGSCWSFSTTGSLEAAHFRATDKLVSLSEQQLVDCSSRYNNQGCNGGLMDNAFQYIKDNGGLDTEQSYPYHAVAEKCHYKKKAIGSTCSGFIDVAEGDEEALKQAVATAGPVSVAIDVTEEHFMLYKDGVFVDETCKNSPDSLDHGVLVVGYGKGKVSGSEDYWIVKNSWGPMWGEQGYIRMARNKKNMCGISTSASYPIVKKH